MLDSTGHADGPPTPISIPLIEQVAGIYAAGAVLAALRLRRRRNIAQTIEIALYDVAFSLMTSFLPVLLSGAPHQGISRVGNRQTMVAPWNVYAAQDGWLLLCAGNDEQWRRICALVGQPERGTHPDFATVPGRLAHVAAVDEIVGDWVARHSVAACVEQFSAAMIPCGPIAPIQGHPREQNLLFRDMIRQLHDPLTRSAVYVPASPLRMSRSPGVAPTRIPAPDEDRDAVTAIARAPAARVDRPAGSIQRPLENLRVIEIGHYTTAPLAARHLANLGADVIKIEPPEGEPVRRWPPAVRGQGTFFTFQNADKKSVVLDIATAPGRADLRRLLAGADVLIENLKPGALARRGFSPADLQAINPRLVYCGVSGFGDDSLYAGRPAFDAVIQATSGLMDVVRAEGIPLKTGPSSADVMGAATALVAIIAALEYRDRTGEGQHIDLSMQDIGAWATQAAWNRNDDAPPSCAVIRCRDGYVLVDATMGDIEDAATLDRDALAARLAQQGLRAAPIFNIEEVVAAGQTTARRLWFMAEEDGAAYPLLASPLRLGLTPATVLRPGPALGRDTEEVLRAL